MKHSIIFTVTLVACVLALSAQAQVVRDTEVAREPAIAKTMEAIEEAEELFIMNHVPFLKSFNDFLNTVDEKCPLKFGLETAFLSDWLDEGAAAARKGLQIQQIYSTELTHGIGEDAEVGIGFEYFQIDTTGAYEGSSTMERDFTVYAPLSWKRFSVSPVWTYIKIDDGDDSGEIGCELSVDMLHFSKNLNNARDEDGVRVFEDIIPWGGLALIAEF